MKILITGMNFANTSSILVTAIQLDVNAKRLLLVGTGIAENTKWVSTLPYLL